MAHELTIQNGTAEMAFVGETPWHGLGQELQEGASIKQWQIAAGMNWEIQSVPVSYTTGISNENPYGEDVLGFDGKNVLYRSDNNNPLSIVSDRYQPVQPKEVLEFFRDLVDENGFKIHTAGTLKGGKKFWALAETGNFGEVAKNDGVGGFLLLSTSCDRSLATTARFTTVRVVCNNTLSMAVEENSNNMVSFSHLQSFDHAKVKEKLGNAVASFGGFLQMAKHLQSIRLNSIASEQFLKELIGNPQLEENPAYDVTKSRQYQKIMSLFDCEAKGLSLVGHTKWGMLNAVTEYIDHHNTSRNKDSRLDSAWFGNGEKLKNKAVELLLA